MTQAERHHVQFLQHSPKSTCTDLPACKAKLKVAYFLLNNGFKRTC